MISEILKRSVFVTAFLLSCQSAQATAQPENADGGDVFIEEENVAEPAERHVMIETIVMLDGKKYVAEVEHVLYDSDELVSVYHQPDGTVSDPIPRWREFAIEVYLRPVGMKITDRWTALRLNAPRFEPNVDVGFTVAPPVMGVGVWRRADGDRLLIGQWNMSDHVAFCSLYAITSEHRMSPVAKVNRNVYVESEKKRKWIPEGVYYAAPGSPSPFLGNIQLSRPVLVDPDARLFLSGNDESIEIVRGAWEHGYKIKGYTYTVDTDEVTSRGPTPAERALFDGIELIGPPHERLMEEDGEPVTVEEWLERQGLRPKRE